ncbi:glucosaminidase domain-containing protein [Rickettsiales bacterium]|nr:glucosaminidase domain-containing protein [Rickettsiales bacterium]
MFGTTKKNSYLILTIIFFVFLNYLVVITKKIFFEKTQYNPINYNILESNNNSTNEKQGSEFISLAKEMFRIFEEHNFSRQSFLNNTYDGLIVFSSLPEDFMSVEPASTRKELFVKTILPIIFLENEKVLAERNKILEWWTDTDGELIMRDYWPDWLKDISEKYLYEGENIGDLLMSVDIVPISLAVSQAAIESGWGTSRYAREGNAVFGQYTYKEDLGILPKDRPDEGKFLIRKFQTISDSTASYIKNLNTHNAYKDFRENRKKIRMNGEKISGISLVKYLINYSERKEDYISDVEKMIKDNDFNDFDAVYSTNLIN